jgi:hypothetical protein
VKLFENWLLKTSFGVWGSALLVPEKNSYPGHQNLSVFFELQEGVLTSLERGESDLPGN